MKKDIKNKHNYHTRSKVKEETDECKNNESSDDDSDWETDEDLEMDDIRKLIGDIFPSSYMKNKIIKGEEQGENITMKKQFKKMKDKFEGGSNRDSSIKKQPKGEKSKSEKPKSEKPKGEKPKGRSQRARSQRGEKP